MISMHWPRPAMKYAAGLLMLLWGSAYRKKSVLPIARWRSSMAAMSLLLFVLQPLQRIFQKPLLPASRKLI
jgi:hypothetical protein